MMFVKLRNWCRAVSAEAGRVVPARLHSAEGFQDLLDRERSRADRSGQHFALVVFQFAGEHAIDRFRLAGRLEERLRAVDHAGWLEGERVGVILTSTQADGAHTFATNITRTGGTPIVCRYDVYVYPGCGSPDPQHQQERRTAATSSAALEQRVAETVDLVQALCDESNRLAPRAESLAPGPNHVGRSGTPSYGTRPLEPLFSRPLPPWKRALDLVGVVVALVLFAPVLLIAAVLVKATSRGSILFSQTRVGLGGRHFTIYKFRTMYVGADARKAELRKHSEQDGPAFKMTHDPRVTPVGRFLRKSCIDELPQLWNVLKGDMTLVGPRPLVTPEADQITGWQRRRIDVTPGLTCIWQVHGKSRVPFVEWMRMDIRYMKSRTILKDLTLIVQTLWNAVRHRGSV